MRSDLEALAAQLEHPLAAQWLAPTTMAWTQLVGSISVEPFGHLHHVIHDYWELLVIDRPHYTDYEAKTDRRIPLVRLKEPG